MSAAGLTAFNNFRTFVKNDSFGSTISAQQVDMSTTNKSNYYVPTQDLEVILLTALCDAPSRLLNDLKAEKKNNACKEDKHYQFKNGVYVCTGVNCEYAELLERCNLLSSSINGINTSGNYEINFGCKKQPTNPILGNYFAYSYITDPLGGNMMNFEDGKINFGKEVNDALTSCKVNTVGSDPAKARVCLNTTMSDMCLGNLRTSFANSGLDKLIASMPYPDNIAATFTTTCDKANENGFRYQPCMSKILQYFFSNTLTVKLVSLEMAAVVWDQANRGCISRADFLSGKVTETNSACLYFQKTLSTRRNLAVTETYTYKDADVDLIPELPTSSTKPTVEITILGTTASKPVILSLI